MDKTGHTVAYVFAAICTVVFVSILFVWRPDTGWPYVLPFLAFGAIILPFAERMKVGPHGVEFERIQQERMHAESAAQEAAIYFGLTMVIGGPLGTAFESGRPLLGVLDRAAGGDTIRPRDLREWLGDVGDYTEEHRQLYVKILEDLAQVGILQVNGEGLDVTATIPAERREAVKRAVAPFLTGEAPDKQ